MQALLQGSCFRLRLAVITAMGLLVLSLGCERETSMVEPTAAPATPRVYSEADEALYRQRFELLMEGAGRRGEGLQLYDILETVEGAPAYSPLPQAVVKALSSSAIEAASAYAAANNSSALMIWREGQLELAEYFGDVDSRTLIVSRSLAKPLSVIAVGRAIAEGHVDSLDQSVADFITEWQGTKKASIKVRHLLDMRSGLLPQSPDMEADSVLSRAYLHPRHDDIIINEYPLVDEPGTRYEYSNATADLVAVLIERATNTRYAAWVSQQVLQPIGASGGEVWTTRKGGLAHAGCCMKLPAESWLRLAVLLLNDGNWLGRQLLPSDYVRAMRTPTPQNPHAGMGVYVGEPYTERRGAANPDRFPELGSFHSEPYLAEDLFLFDGNANQVVYIVPSRELVILRTGGQAPKSPEWDNAYLPNLILRDLAEAANTTSAE